MNIKKEYLALYLHPRDMYCMLWSKFCRTNIGQAAAWLALPSPTHLLRVPVLTVMFLTATVSSWKLWLPAIYSIMLIWGTRMDMLLYWQI